MQELEKMVSELLEVESGLSSWEMDFIENMDGKRNFSEKQSDKIKAIWSKVLG